MKRGMLLALTIALLVAPIAGAAPALAQSSGTATATPTPTATPTTNATAAGGTTSSGGPATGSTVRILPIQLEADFVGVTVHKQGQVYNTTGPFAFFSLSEPVDEAAVQQQGAQATVLEGGHVVRVQYAEDAAPVGKQSLYELELWFADGSTKTVDLYASKTSVSVGAAEMRKYRPVLLDMLADAEDNGYERSPEGLESHYTDIQETAQLLDSLLTEQAKRLFGSLLGIVMNPLGIAALLISAALLALWQLRRNGQALEILSDSRGKAAQMRERLWIQYKNQQQSAADEQLRELDGIGEMGEIYWSDAFGVSTTAGLAELFRTGLPVRRDGETKHVGGVDDLDAESIDSSWIEAVCREHRLPSTEIALTHGKIALHRMISKYGMAHHYEAPYRRVRELIDELDESRDVQRHTGSSIDSSGVGFGGSSPAGGDD